MHPSQSRPLAKLKGVNISAVGWGRPAPPQLDPGEERDLRNMEDPSTELASRYV